MVQATTLPRNEAGIAAAIDTLKARFGDQLQTGQAIREQHGHTTTWITNQAPDAVVFPTSAAEVSEIVKTCAEHGVPVIPFGTGTSLEGHVNAPAGGICIDMMKMDK
ncbi:MAG: FAD-binding protein, partial [Pseudomonadota bacterium]|nr:FAD-binding protein [Pseudomonadota bacterium]